MQALLVSVGATAAVHLLRQMGMRFVAMAAAGWAVHFMLRPLIIWVTLSRMPCLRLTLDCCPATSAACIAAVLLWPHVLRSDRLKPA